MEASMAKPSDFLLTGLAPAIWGSTYIVTTQWLPPGYPLTVSLLRALPAGIILLLVVRRLPQLRWLPKLFLLGFLNFTLFWTLLFVAAYRLPGGVAATLGATQPLIVLFLARALIGAPIRPLAVGAAIAGLAGVGLLLISSHISLDPVGVAAAFGGALSMAFGTVLTRKWQWPVSPLTLTAWQLTAGGLLLVPIALLAERGFPLPDMKNLAGLVWLGLVGAALTYVLWFRGIARIGPGNAALLGFLSPLSAVLLGWLILGEALTPIQLAGAALVMASLWTGQRAGRTTPDAFGKSIAETKTPAE
ncbi:EamA family transporter [Martelella soudanensis]|uniref:EamA family transporter n=1 Tax=unclassified Martelella TaxID=2629616 RepID=UPI001AED8824|nr:MULTISPECIES: EamA family transporter [unclassified Martelella]